MKALEQGDRLAAEARERAEKEAEKHDPDFTPCPDNDHCLCCIGLRLARDSAALCAEVERRGEAIRHMTRSLLEHEGCRCPKGDVLREVAAILEAR